MKTKRQRKKSRGMNAAAKRWSEEGYRLAFYDRYGLKFQTGVPYVNLDNY